jgi:hypothetical protein
MIPLNFIDGWFHGLQNDCIWVLILAEQLILTNVIAFCPNIELFIPDCMRRCPPGWWTQPFPSFSLVRTLQPQHITRLFHGLGRSFLASGLAPF